MILQIPISSTLSFSSQMVSDPTHRFLTSRLTHLSIANPPASTTIRMGGGPRTYPGGVSKWQWKRMQAKKGKQLLRARLARERQIYEMRKRAELSAAVSELERPWEVVEKAAKLFSMTADEQLKVLADRFQKPGGFEKDEPQLLETYDGVPSVRFFPKGVVHSIKGKNDLGVGYRIPIRDSRENGNENKDGRRRRGREISGLDRRGNGIKEEFGLVFDMNLQDDGSYGISNKESEIAHRRERK